MARVQKEVRYLNKDFGAFREGLVEFAKSYYPNTYNDFNEASPGMMFLETTAYVGDESGNVGCSTIPPPPPPPAYKPAPPPPATARTWALCVPGKGLPCPVVYVPELVKVVTLAGIVTTEEPGLFSTPITPPLRLISFLL